MKNTKKAMKKKKDWQTKEKKRHFKQRDKGIAGLLFNESACIRTLGIFSGNRKLKEMPHSDSLNYYLKKLSPECLGELRRKMIKSFLRMKIFYRNRADDEAVQRKWV